MRRPGVMVCASGPAMTNTVTPMYVATESAMPLLVLGGSAAAVGALGTGTFQETDQTAFAKPACKWVQHVDTPEHIPELVYLALGKAAQGKPGAVCKMMRILSALRGHLLPADPLFLPSQTSTSRATLRRGASQRRCGCALACRTSPPPTLPPTPSNASPRCSPARSGLSSFLAKARRGAELGQRSALSCRSGFPSSRRPWAAARCRTTTRTMPAARGPSACARRTPC